MKSKQHLNYFKNGVTFFLTNEQYENYLKGKSKWGRPDGQFVIPTDAAESIDKEIMQLIENKLGINKEAFTNGNGLLRVDVLNHEKYNLRQISGEESGINKRFLRGGFTEGGVPEAIIDPVLPKDAERKGLFSLIIPEPNLWAEQKEIPSWIYKRLRADRRKKKDLRTQFFKGRHFLYKIEYASDNKIRLYKRLRKRWQYQFNKLLNKLKFIN